MASVFYGFVTKTSYINNEPRRVATFYELSPIAKTYSKGPSEFTSLSDHPGDTLNVFLSVDSHDYEIVMSTPLVKLTLDVAKTVQSYCVDNRGVIDARYFVNFINSTYDNVVFGFEHGEFSEAEGMELPDWFSFHSQEHDAFVRIWLKTEAFEAQYPTGSAVVIHPLMDFDLDFYFNNYATVVAKLQEVSLSTFSDFVQEARDSYPPTYTRYREFELINRGNPTTRFKTTWAVLLYGQSEDHIDGIKDAIADYLVKNSSHSAEEWETIFPEIFRRTEFLYFPRWDNYSIRNITENSSLYSQIVNADEMAAFVQTNHPGNPSLSYVRQHLEIIPFNYKSVICGTIKGESNVIGVTSLKTLFNDFLAVPTTSDDFNRMTIETREWALKMVEALHVAETTTIYSNVKSPFRRVIRGGVVFVSYFHNQVNHLIAAKGSSIYQ